MILFYTEGGHYLGLGNIFRSLSLARALRSGVCPDVRFLTSSEPYACDIIRNAGFEVTCTPDLLPAIDSLAPHTLVIDYLGIGEDFVQSARAGGRTKVVLIGNDSSANHSADIVVNAIIGTGFENRCFRDSYGTLNLWGPKYLVLREEFEAIRDSYSYKGHISTVVMLFGGSDQADFSSRVLSRFSGKGYRILLILGAGYRNDDELSAVLASFEGEVEVLHSISNVSQIYKQADFLLTSPGTALFEGLCPGIPAISYFQNESQKAVFGPFMTTAEFTDQTDPVADMERIYADYEGFRAQLRRFAVGTGRNEIIENILAL